MPSNRLDDLIELPTSSTSLLRSFQSHPFSIIGLGVGIVCLLISVSLYGLYLKQDQIPVEIQHSSDTVANQALIYVDIAGAVGKPGLYKLSPKARFNDLLMEAGGLLPEVDRVWVSQKLNLAQSLTDSQKIYVPFKGEQVDDQSIVLGASDHGSSILNLNQASLAQLDTLPGIGPATAAKIIDYRQSHGPFASVEALSEVPGIGQKTVENLRPLVSVGN